MTRFSCHCSKWKRRDCNVSEDGAEFIQFRGNQAGVVKQLRVALLIVFLAVTTSSFPTPLVASSTSTISPAPQINSNLSTRVQLFQPSNRRAGRFSTMEETKPSNARRRLAGRYMCMWKKDICEQEPINFLLGPDCCNSVCTNMKTDMFNCGTCGHICFYGSICCNGICKDIFSDKKNCGGCDNICPLGEVCEYGLCGYT